MGEALASLRTLVLSLILQRDRVIAGS